MKATFYIIPALLFAICIYAKANPGNSGLSTASTMACATIVSPASLSVANEETRKTAVLMTNTSKTDKKTTTLQTTSGESVSNGKYSSTLFAFESESQISFSISIPEKIILSGKHSTLVIHNLNVYAGQTSLLASLNQKKSVNSENGRLLLYMDGTANTNTTDNYTGSYAMSVDYQ